MVLTTKNKFEVLEELNKELTALAAERSIIVCGGGALLVLDIIDRRTRDMDVISPKIDPVLEMAAKKVSEYFGLAPNWLNNGPESLTQELTKGWRERTVKIFKGSHLEVRALGRHDLVATKMFAFCDREDDFADLIQLKPTAKELDKTFDWVIKRDASEYWPGRVRDCFARLRKALGYASGN